MPLGPLGIGSTHFSWFYKYLDTGNGREVGGEGSFPFHHEDMPHRMAYINWVAALLRYPHLSSKFFVFLVLGLLSVIRICGKCLQWGVHIL